MKELLFKIKELYCSYDNQQTVLKISELDIPKGETVFVLGASGIGKSTFIETLGLMNDTIQLKPDTQILFYPSGQSSSIEIKDYWKKEDKIVSSFRNNYFSFIFQSTNLMPNFSAGENMCISQLIQGQSLTAAKSQVKNVMEELNLPYEIFDKKITELSGGQRQRLAFVRAVTSGFEVLFGDEPTGNLDRYTAYRLMQILKTNLQKNNRTAIIVSHDIDLALNFADRIILLSKNEEAGYGEVKSNNSLVRKGEQFQPLDGTTIHNITEHIHTVLGVHLAILQ